MQYVTDRQVVFIKEYELVGHYSRYPWNFRYIKLIWKVEIAEFYLNN